MFRSFFFLISFSLFVGVFPHQSAALKCSVTHAKYCADTAICFRSTRMVDGIRQWIPENEAIAKSFLREARKRGLACNVGFSGALTAKNAKFGDNAGVCTPVDPSGCTDAALCANATTVANGKKTWRVPVNLSDTIFRKEAKRRGLSCGVKIKSVSYTEKCRLKKSDVESAQTYLKELGLYKSSVDGIAGRGTLKAIEQSRILTNTRVTKGACLTTAEIQKIKNVVEEKKCKLEQIRKCTPKQICSKATKIRNGLVVWDFTSVGWLNEAQGRELDCKISFDDSESSAGEAVQILTYLTDYVGDNPDEFDLNFAQKFNKVRSILNGVWNDQLKAEFILFRAYLTSYPKFEKYVADKRLSKLEEERKRLEELRSLISADLELLKDWAKNNVLDPKAADVALLVGRFGDQDEQSEQRLQEFRDDAQSLLLSTGLVDDPNRSMCTSLSVEECTPKILCERATEEIDGETNWLDNNFSLYAQKIGQTCGVPEVCELDNTDACSNADICQRATVLREGIRSWKVDDDWFTNRAAELNLDCGVSIDDTPFTQQEALYYLEQLVTFVSENPNEFDLRFASEFNKVRQILDGNWNNVLSKNMELFRIYLAQSVNFNRYLEKQRIDAEEAEKERVAELAEKLQSNMMVLTTWASNNVLDQKAAVIANLNSRAQNLGEQSIAVLDALVRETDALLIATGISGVTVNSEAQELIDGLYNPSSFYVFANVGGDAASVYRNLKGEFQFEQDKGTYCGSSKLSEFDNYLLEQRVLEYFSGVELLQPGCSPSTDVFIVKGNELTSNLVLGIIDNNKLLQILEVTKEERDQAFDQLSFLQSSIEKEVLEGTRVGFGILRNADVVSNVCAVVSSKTEGHEEQLLSNKFLLGAIGFASTEFSAVYDDSEEVFKALQRNQCQAIYGGSLDLGRIYLAGNVAGMDLQFAPFWVSNATVSLAQEEYDKDLAKLAAVEQNLLDKAVLDEQSKKSAAEVAANKQRVLREQNGLRFAVLRDSFQEKIYEAIDFGFNNPADDEDYIQNYLKLSSVDELTRRSPFDEIIESMQNDAAERWEITERDLDRLDFGTAVFGGRTVDAIVLELTVDSKNKLIGQYREYCRTVLTLWDNDFEMWRNILIVECEDKNEPQIKRWKAENSFVSQWIVSAGD